jgi:hypothetical protein
MVIIEKTAHTLEGITEAIASFKEKWRNCG